MNLDDDIGIHLRLTKLQRIALERLGLVSVEDLLRHFPHRYESPAPTRLIRELTEGENAKIAGEVIAVKTGKSFRSKMPIGEITISDSTGQVKAVWFHQVYLAKQLSIGELVSIHGRVTKRNDKLYFANPEVDRLKNLPRYNHPLLAGDEEENKEFLSPVYPETRGLSSSWFQHAIRRLLHQIEADQITDSLPKIILDRYKLPSLATALFWIHSPRQENDALVARKRFAFEEIFFIQLTRLLAKHHYQHHPNYHFQTDPKTIENFTNRFPFKLTTGQQRAIQQIIGDLEKETPMMRLLEGDVGSGKTAVAATVAAATVAAGLEVAYMAPTEILARQHFESFIDYFRYLPNVQIGLITGKGCYKFPSKINPSGYTNISRSQLLKWVKNGEIPILVGTQTLIQKTVEFKRLGLAIIDEQHRFGIIQRSKLVKRKIGKSVELPVPHLLSMTATPIPRTLALTIYGDLDLTLLDEMPPGRKRIITKIVSDDQRQEVYTAIKEEIKKGFQAYIICPRIDEPDPLKALALQAKSAKQEHKKLAEKIFPEYTVGLVHSKLKSKDKETVMEKFARGEINILVATSVVEVGVNVPNATIIAIEGAERFGLAQLHQLRGRVWRSKEQAYCYLFYEKKGGKSLERLKILETAESGFALAEHDLKLRGAGSLSGLKQWGISDVGMEAIKNLKMVEAARTEASAIIAEDPTLTKHSQLAERLKQSEVEEIHFE